MPSTIHAQRQPSGPPAQTAMRADEHRAREAEAVADHVVERRHPGAHADRVVVGDQRLVHRNRVRLGDAGEEPRPEQHERVDARARTGTRRSRRSRLETPTIGTRFTRSASQPIGTAPSTKNAADAVLMKTIVPSLIPNVCADLGREHVDRGALELVERVEQREDDEHERAADLRCPARSEIGSELTPGSRSSGKITCSRALRLRGLARLFLVDDRGRERRRSEFVGHPDPPVVGAAERTCHLTRVSATRRVPR